MNKWDTLDTKQHLSRVVNRVDAIEKLIFELLESEGFTAKSLAYYKMRLLELYITSLSEHIAEMPDGFLCKVLSLHRDSELRHHQRLLADFEAEEDD